MADEQNHGEVRAEEVVGLRELITQVLREERAVFYPRPLVEDMEELRRSPAGAVIRLEEKVDRLSEDMAGIKAELSSIGAQMATKAELHQLDRRLQGLEETTQADFRRLEEAQANFVTKEDFRRLEETTKADLRRLEETMKEDFRRLEEAQANFVTKEDFRRLEEAQANFVTKEDFRNHETRLERLEDEVRSLREDLHNQHVSTMRMFFVLLAAMIILNGDKVVKFLGLLIP